jgi:hypothetical protein
LNFDVPLPSHGQKRGDKINFFVAMSLQPKIKNYFFLSPDIRLLSEPFLLKPSSFLDHSLQHPAGKPKPGQFSSRKRAMATRLQTYPR